MTKHRRLIPGENNNWEVASFLLIDFLYIANSQMRHIEFSRADTHSSTKALNFIENLLGPTGHVVNKTLSNSISSAITRLEQKGYLICEDGECILTKDGFDRSREIKDKYDKKNEEPIGAYGKALQALQSIEDPEIRKKVLENMNELSSKK
ncbi:MAG: hypothetical protein KKE62_07345 [Proteobacteria bacterium]|nr:hypothetical protein [Pseudomonadota bacterium]MBU1389707.1 hypothetical protein [Pseudomonadota bacterium]MBU1542645.1 hypothetical protein [Pseudomonadota bacterium]MBU2479527.1 hypothetical protein [Pseudomonadota bacterium]